MNENAALWVEALLSGEYKQAQGTLRRENFSSEFSYCCLGVACEVFRKATGRGEWLPDSTFTVDGVRESGILPRPVRDWLGLSSSDGRHGEGFKTTALTGLNDLQGWSFEQIAARIKEEPYGMFRSARNQEVSTP